MSDNKGKTIKLKVPSPAPFSQHIKVPEQGSSELISGEPDGGNWKTDSSLTSEETLEFSMRLGTRPISFKAKVLYVNPSNYRGFELGISIEEMGDEDRVAWTRFVIQKWRQEGI